MSGSANDLTCYCGLYCGDCYNYKGEIADLARDLRKKLREADFETCIKLDFLKPIHAEAHIKNLRTIKKNGMAGFVNGKRHWYAAGE